MATVASASIERALGSADAEDRRQATAELGASPWTRRCPSSSPRSATRTGACARRRRWSPNRSRARRRWWRPWSRSSPAATTSGCATPRSTSSPAQAARPPPRSPRRSPASTPTGASWRWRRWARQGPRGARRAQASAGRRRRQRARGGHRGHRRPGPAGARAGGGAPPRVPRRRRPARSAHRAGGAHRARGRHPSAASQSSGHRTPGLRRCGGRALLEPGGRPRPHRGAVPCARERVGSSPDGARPPRRWTARVERRRGALGRRARARRAPRQRGSRRSTGPAPGSAP